MLTEIKEMARVVGKSALVGIALGVGVVATLAVINSIVDSSITLNILNITIDKFMFLSTGASMANVAIMMNEEESGNFHM